MIEKRIICVGSLSTYIKLELPEDTIYVNLEEMDNEIRATASSDKRYLFKGVRRPTDYGIISDIPYNEFIRRLSIENNGKVIYNFNAELSCLVKKMKEILGLEKKCLDDLNKL